MKRTSSPLAPMHPGAPGPWLSQDAQQAALRRQPMGMLGEERDGLTPTQQVPPGWTVETFEQDLAEGETVLCSVPGSSGRADVFLSVPDDWIKSGATIRVYQDTGVGRALVGSELLSALPLTSSSGWSTGRACSLASSGGHGWTVTLLAPPGSGVTGQGRVTLTTAPNAGASGMLAAPLGGAQGHTDRAEHLRGAALLGIDDADGRWYALGVGETGRRLRVQALSDPATDYEEHAAPVGAFGRAFRNATGAVLASVTVTTLAGGPRVFSNLQPGEVVPVQIGGIVASSAWPVGIFAL